MSSLGWCQAQINAGGHVRKGTQREGQAKVNTQISFMTPKLEQLRARLTDHHRCDYPVRRQQKLCLMKERGVLEATWKGNKANRLGAEFSLYDGNRHGVGIFLKEEFFRDICRKRGMSL